jgi:hypothetical protein
MADSADERGLFPDSISGRRLRDLLKRQLPELPVSDKVPSLEFRDEDLGSGGLCDLQFVIIQLVEKSQSGLEYVQLLTASLYLFERCFEFLGQSIDDANETYDGSNKDAVIGELRSFQLIFQRVLRQFNELHLAMSAAASLERIQKLHLQQGADMSDQEAESRLLISEGLIQSLGLDRESITTYIQQST